MTGSLLPTTSHFLQNMIKNMTISTSVRFPETGEMYDF